MKELINKNTGLNDCENCTTGTNHSTRTQDAIKVIDKYKRTFQLFMGHRVRCTNQNKAISSIEQKLERDCMDATKKSISAIIIGDFKMKFDPLSARETTLDYFGKKGISWHGSKKMNAAMMWEKLQKLYPYVFSIPGETENKKYISLLFSKSKSRRKGYNDESMDIELNEEAISLSDDNQSEITERINWEKLKEIVEENPTEKPEVIFET